MQNHIKIAGETRLYIRLPNFLPAPEGIDGMVMVDQDAHETGYELDWTQNNMFKLAFWHNSYQTWRYFSGQRVLSRAIPDYHWPGQFTPMHHQMRIVNFLTTNRRGFCLAGMGTGKTAAAIWSVDYLRTLGMSPRVLVVCPKSILRSAWEDDLLALVPDDQYKIMDGAKDIRTRMLRSNAQWFVTNFDGIKVLKDDLLTMGIEHVIIDESTAYKSVSTERWKLMRKLVPPHVWCWGMTGTPYPQGPEDAYGQSKLVTPENAPRTLTMWRMETMYRINKNIYKARDDWHAKAASIMQPCIYISKEEAALNLPPKVDQFLEVEHTPEQKKYLNDLRKNFVAQVADGLQITAANAAVLYGKVQQVFTGHIKTDNGEVAHINNKPREAEMLRIIEQTKNEADTTVAKGKPVGKTLVFVPYKAAGEHLYRVVQQAGYSCAYICGDTSGRERADILRRFQQTAEPQVIVANPRTFSHGITATAASSIIWFSAPASTETFLQANDRIDRPGQTQHMNVFYLHGDNSERKYYENLIRNNNNQNIALQMLKDFIRV